MTLKQRVLSFYLLSLFFLSWTAQAGILQVPKASGLGLENGVSKKLAAYRKSVLSKVRYELEFDLPEERQAAIQAKEVLRFELKEVKFPLQIDFKENAAKLKSVLVNQKKVPAQHQKEHLIIPAAYLKSGSNEVKIDFQAGEGALNRNTDYLYTLFVPDRARTVFPCFDQPNLKATYTLSLKLPLHWKAISNGILKDSLLENNRKVYKFNTSQAISTYLFAFAAGRFTQSQGMVSSMKTEFLFRETDTAKIRLSVPEIFKTHSNALKYLEQWTGIAYPFQKFGYVAIPDFQFGGMEHPGAIQYKAASLFLDNGATKDQINARNNLIAHETSHMWFGDLVTMDWFNDVWMKEVFANFMADKSMADANGSDEFDLKFLVDHFPAAYATDRTQGSNPIRQELDNLNEAGTMYGNIIYHKAPIMMRQLERLIGPEAFQKGIREYLRKFAGGNASWPDLIAILSKYSSADLKRWNKVWVNETGMPKIDYQMELKEGKINRLTIEQAPEQGLPRVWPQSFELTFFYPNYSREMTVRLDGAKTELKEAFGLEKPSFILFNSSGQGYGRWPVDTAMFAQLYKIEKPLRRASAYISLYENMLRAKSIEPGQLLNLFIQGLDKETDELSLKLINGYISAIFWNFSTMPERLKIAATLEDSLWSALQAQNSPNQKKILFKTYQDIYLSTAAADRLYQIWKSQTAPAGIRLSEDDYTSLAFSLALKGNADTSILRTQLGRITNADRKKRFEFIMPALSADQGTRDQFFKSLKEKQNRAKESNVLAALYYLHHPLRQNSSVRYLPESLNLLEELQVTGDIFFPQSWLQATFGNYQSTAAANTVRDFLKTHPSYNPKLRAKILQAADNLFRAEKLLK
jgi:aminopeptidase N